MNFSNAVEVMRAGGSAARAAWNASGLRLEMTDNRIYKVRGARTADSEVWQTNQTDVLADDWVEVARPPVVRTLEDYVQEQVLCGDYAVPALAHITDDGEVCVNVTAGGKRFAMLLKGNTVTSVAAPAATKPPTQRAAVGGFDAFGAMGNAS